MNRCHLYRLARSAALITAAVVGLTGCVHRAAEVADSELEIKKNINLGVILDTTLPLELSIPIKNPGHRVVTISKVSKDCSCTSVSIDKVKLLPGETARLRVVTNLTGKTNLFTSDIIVESDALEKIDEIQIQGQITGQIRIRPLRATVLLGHEYKPASFTVFCDDQNGKWRYAGFASNDPRLDVVIRPEETSPTTSTYEAVVNVDHRPTAGPYADYHESGITMKFVNDHLQKTLVLKYPIDVVVHEKLTTDPSQVVFENQGPQKRTVLVQGGDAVRVDSVMCSSPCVRATINGFDQTTLTLELAFIPDAHHGDPPRQIVCHLLAAGKSLAAIPVSIVNIP